MSGIINSPCIVTPLLRRKVKLRAVCKAVPLQQQCSDWGISIVWLLWATQQRVGGGSNGAQPGAKDFDTNIITDN